MLPAADVERVAARTATAAMRGRCATHPLAAFAEIEGEPGRWRR